MIAAMLRNCTAVGILVGVGLVLFAPATSPESAAMLGLLAGLMAALVTRGQRR